MLKTEVEKKHFTWQKAMDIVQEIKETEKVFANYIGKALYNWGKKNNSRKIGKRSEGSYEKKSKES